MEKIINIKGFGKIEGKGYWRILDELDKSHNVFPNVPGFDLLAPNKTVKLIKEQKGEFWNVVKVEAVNSLPEQVPAPINAPKPTPAPVDKPRPPINDDRNRTMTLSYAKDLVVAGKVKIENMLAVAEYMNRYCTGAITIEDDKVLKIMKGEVPEVKETKK